MKEITPKIRKLLESDTPEDIIVGLKLVGIKTFFQLQELALGISSAEDEGSIYTFTRFSKILSAGRQLIEIEQNDKP